MKTEKIKCHNCGKTDYEIIEDDIYRCNLCGSEYDWYAIKAKQGKKKYMLAMMDELLPCRKCGKEAWAEEYGKGKFHIVEIFCSNNKCGNTEAWSRKEINNAIKAWNKRIEKGEKNEMVEKME